ncbi:MAG: thiamine diphosphokinase [Ardenticatenaceae bacterium]|nr:thiamine diphosphokinase [Ardenticatenaceae bacterium]
MPILLFANGDIENTAWLAKHLQSATAVIAVDGGARHLETYEKDPDVLIGDLDSLDPKTVQQLQARGTKIIQYPQAKDETDLELALLYAVNQSMWKDQPLFIFGVLGGRLDQTLANILLLAHPRLKDRHVRILEQHQQAWLVSDSTQIHGQIGDMVSLVPLGGSVEIERTMGLEWPLIKERLSFGPARGVSNRLTRSTATVKINSGQLLCIHTDRSWSR